MLLPSTNHAEPWPSVTKQWGRDELRRRLHKCLGSANGFGLRTLEGGGFSVHSISLACKSNHMLPSGKECGFCSVTSISVGKPADHMPLKNAVTRLIGN